jgi:hypothetical protein
MIEGSMAVLFYPFEGIAPFNIPVEKLTLGVCRLHRFIYLLRNVKIVISVSGDIDDP